MRSLTQSEPLSHLVRYAASQASAKYDSPADATRIAKAVDLILAGHVDMLATGGARVKSQDTARLTYHVNGACECLDFGGRNGERCKHRYAKAILARAFALYPSTYYAIYTEVNGTEHVGLAFADMFDWTFVPDSGAAGWSCDLESLQVLGNVMLAEQQRRQDGDLVSKIAGRA